MCTNGCERKKILVVWKNCMFVAFCQKMSMRVLLSKGVEYVSFCQRVIMNVLLSKDVIMCHFSKDVNVCPFVKGY